MSKKPRVALRVEEPVCSYCSRMSQESDWLIMKSQEAQGMSQGLAVKSDRHDDKTWSCIESLRVELEEAGCSPAL